MSSLHRSGLELDGSRKITLAVAGRNHALAKHGAMPSRWPAEPCRTSLSPASTAGSGISRLRVPARGRASADRHGICWLLRRLSRYHGSLRAARNRGRSGPQVITKLPATMPRPATRALLAHARTAARPTPGPRCRPMLKQCCGVCLNEAGRPAALIQDGSSMLVLLPRFLLFLQRMATGDEDPPAGCPVSMPRR